MNNNVINQTEMMKLAFGLRDRNIEFTVTSFLNGLQIKAEGWDAICHDGSYGRESGLIEVMGLFDDDDVTGYLTAEDILKKIDEDT
jgi:hypothetical protein